MAKALPDAGLSRRMVAPGPHEPQGSRILRHLARFPCRRIAVMQFGRLRETGPAGQVFTPPRHDDTRALIGTPHGVPERGAARGDPPCPPAR